MKTIKKGLSALFIAAFVVALSACSGNESGNNTTKSDSTKTATDTAVVKPTQSKKQYSEIPSPNQMFAFIKQGGFKYDKSLINTTDNVSNYVQPVKQQLNFGIYAGDMAYTAAFEQYQTTLKYFGAINKLAGEIGISDAFNQKTVDRVRNNLSNADSLVNITNDSYYTIIEYLEANGRGATIATMAAGGWLESTYIVTQSMKKYDASSPAIDRLADQQLTLANLFDNFKKNQNNKAVRETMKMFQPLKAAFDNLGQETTKSTTKQKGNKLVFGGGTEIKMSQKQFENIKSIIQKLRSEIVKTGN